MQAVLVRDKENKRTQNASLSVNSPSYAKNYPMCSCVILPHSPENLEKKSGILVPCGFGMVSNW
jgi:hypothetical protein